MSKTLIAQNLKLLEVMHPELPFLQKFSPTHLSEIAAKAHIFVFNSGTILAQQKQQIDYFGIVLEGKVIVSGESDKKTVGFVFGHLKLLNLLENHARSIIGDSDGLILAFRFNDIPKFSNEIRNDLTEICLRQSFSSLKGERVYETEWVNEEQKKTIGMLTPQIKAFFNEQLDQKERRLWFRYFPAKVIASKDLVKQKSSDPYLILVLKGQLIVKSGSGIETINSGHFYNIEGFLLNFTTNSNIYCSSQYATVMMISRQIFLRLLKPQTFYIFSNFLIRNEINVKNYEIETYEKRKEKEKQSNAKWTVFAKSNQFQILPLNISQYTLKDQGHSRNKPTLRQEPKDYMGIFFREQMAQNKNLKTNSSNNSKINKVITLKTEKNEAIQKNSTENQLKNLQKQLEQTNAKIKFYEENYIKLKLEMIQYRSKCNMNEVFKQINQRGDKKTKNQSLMAQNAKVTTLKDAFQEQMKNNRIMEVVARCAYKWLWTVRRKKQKRLAQQQQTEKL